MRLKVTGNYRKICFLLQLLDSYLRLTVVAPHMNSHLNGLNICFNKRSTQLLNQMSGSGLNRSFNINENVKNVECLLKVY